MSKVPKLAFLVCCGRQLVTGVRSEEVVFKFSKKVIFEGRRPGDFFGICVVLCSLVLVFGCFICHMEVQIASLVVSLKLRFGIVHVFSLLIGRTAVKNC